MNPLLIGGVVLGLIALSSRSKAQGTPTDSGGGLPTDGGGGPLPTGGSGGGLPTGGGGGLPTGGSGSGSPTGSNFVGYYMGMPCMRDQLDYNLRLAKENTFWLPAQTSGCEVLTLQVELNKSLPTPLLTDGIFGPATESALKNLLNVSSITLSQIGLADPSPSGGASGGW